MTSEIVFIVNPAASGGRLRRRWRAYERHIERSFGHALDVRLTSHPGDATRLARDAVAEGTTTLVSVGGDGTLNEVVNGMMADSGRPLNPDSRLAVLSLGTGADFVRTMGWSDDPSEFLERIGSDQTTRLDVGLCEFGDPSNAGRRYFINIGEFGSGGAVVERVNRTTKILGGRLSFTLAILSTLPKYANTRVGYAANGGPRVEVTVNDFIVANCRFFGGGLQPAPHADPADGLFDVVVVGDIDFKTVRKNLGALRSGTHLTLPDITWFRASEIVVNTGDEMIDLDGEYVGRHPRRFTNLASCLPFADGGRKG
jgi:diacylglycerol kinase (ATP)